jgi:alkanesulfonate monooxygenase SsuD/methylene tetrahydromethanopterin reductase-like flavin-dependent oxidoreductase (luciferase family)
VTPLPGRRLAVNLPQVVGRTLAADIAGFAARAEVHGFARLWSFDQALPGRPAGVLDGLHALTFAAACTRHVELAIGVIALPQREPVLLAKELASIDVLSQGRLTVGVGLGLRDPGAAPAAAPGRSRAALLEDGIGVLRALWSGASGVPRVWPLPAQPGGPALWLGGAAPPALERAARLADGWIGAGGAGPGDFARQLRTLRAMLDRHGRDPGGFAIAKRVFVAVDDDDVARAERRLDRALDELYGRAGLAPACGVYGSVEHCAAQLEALFEAGAHELVLHPLFDHLDQLDALHGVAAMTSATSGRADSLRDVPR